MGGVPAYVDPSFGKLAADEINFWAFAPQAGVGGAGTTYTQVVTPSVVPGVIGPLPQSPPPENDLFGDPATGNWVDDAGDVLRNAYRGLKNIYDVGKSIYDLGSDVLDFWQDGKIPQFGAGELPGRGQGLAAGGGMIGGSRVRYGPWGPVPAVSRLETIAKFGRELTDSEFAAHFGYYPGSGRRRFRRRYGGMRYGTGFRGRRSTGRTRRYY